MPKINFMAIHILNPIRKNSEAVHSKQELSSFHGYIFQEK